MDQFEPIITEDNQELLNGAIDVVKNYHADRNRGVITFCETRPSDFHEFVVARRISVYVKVRMDETEYKYVVVLSERTGQYELVEDPYTK